MQILAPLQVLATTAEMRSVRREAARRGQTVGLVPTMGALHAGHLSLVTAARASCDIVVASIFVNPTQFAPNEDFTKYPRTFDADRALLQEAGVDFVFAPSVAEMYPAGASTKVVVEGVSDRLDGASRPGHFHGVSTVVSKLFHIVQPDRAYFGQKDAAQVAVLRKMVRDLDFNLELAVCPIIRDADGLALSSRNRYLTPAQRRQALVLRRALLRVEETFAAGETSPPALIQAAQQVLAEEPGVRIDYLAVIDPDTLLEVEITGRNTLVAIAAFIGTTRLIDNTLL
jgi:pantoate--beta-alanine ligase